MQQVVSDRVSRAMKRVAVVVALAAIAGAIWYLRRPAATAASSSAGSEPAPVANPPPPIATVTKLATQGERNQLARRIASAQAGRATASRGAAGTAATRASAAPSLPPQAVDDNQAETLKVEIRTAMREVIPLLAECYEAALPGLAEPELRIVAELALTGDPDIGSLIDAKQLADGAGKPLPAGFDDCLRTTFQSLALPPLAEGDRFEVHYPFVFAKN